MKDLGLCLVTGANGFVGRVLVAELLLQRCQVRVMSRDTRQSFPGCDVIQCGLSIEPVAYENALRGVQTVFHLAGIAHAKADARDYEWNAEASVALAKQSSVSGVKRFIYVSSTKAMIDPGSEIGTEDLDAMPHEPYGYWKRITEQRLLHDISVEHIAILRPCLIYGPGVKGNLLSMMKAIKRNVFPPLPETGAVRSMVSVADVAKALLVLASNDAANKHVFIASDGEAYTAHGIYLSMRKALGKSDSSWQVPVELLRFVGVSGDLVNRFWKRFPLNSGTVQRLVGPAHYSAARLRSLGWEPSTTFDRELPAMVAVCLRGD